MKTVYFNPKTQTLLEDSEGVYGEESFSIQDWVARGWLLYMSFEEAKAQATAIAKGKMCKDCEGNRKYYPSGWGTDLKNLHILYVDKIGKRTYWEFDSYDLQ